jgi:hypothetical protein
VRGRPVSVRVRGLPYFDQVAVGIADVAAGFVLVLFRRGQELGAPGAPFGVHGLNVLDPDVEEAADPVGVARRLQGDRRLVVGGAAADVDDDPGVGQRDVGQPARTGEGHPAAQYLGIEAPGALDIVRDDEVSQHNSLWRRRELSHLAPPLVGAHAPAYDGAAADVTHRVRSQAGAAWSWLQDRAAGGLIAPGGVPGGTRVLGPGSPRAKAVPAPPAWPGSAGPKRVRTSSRRRRKRHGAPFPALSAW